MDWHGKSIRMGALVLAVAVILRLWSAGALETVYAALVSPTVGSFLLYLETGRVIRPVPDPTELDPAKPDPTEEEPALPERPQFSAGDASLVRVWGTGEAVDSAACLERTLDMDLTGEAPTVLILHTHATESYTQAQGWTYEESSNYRTLDTDHNMVAIGTYLTELLEAGGIQVIHDTTLHDYPEYTGAYTRSEATARKHMEDHSGIFLVLDLHRDSLSDDQGGELDTSALVKGRESAQLMFLMGTDHDAWQENMNLAVKLTAQLERTYPGITRGILTRNDDYNQYLTPGTLLVEVGAAGNTQEEAMMAAEALAEAILALKYGVE